MKKVCHSLKYETEYLPEEGKEEERKKGRHEKKVTNYHAGTILEDDNERN